MVSNAAFSYFRSKPARPGSDVSTYYIMLYARKSRCDTALGLIDGTLCCQNIYVARMDGAMEPISCSIGDPTLLLEQVVA